MAPFLIPIVSMLADKGLDLISGAIEGGADKAVEYVEEKTGVKLDSKKGLSEEDVEKLKLFQENNMQELKLFYADRASARDMNIKLTASKDWLVRNTGSMIAIFVMVSSFVLDLYILNEGITNGVESLNPIVTLIAGAISARAVQVLSFYFGDSKSNADSNRRI